MNNRVTIAGVIETDPLLTYSPDGTPHCAFMVAAHAQLILVAVSSTHALWLVSTLSAGALVTIAGHWRADAWGPVLQAVVVSAT